MSDELKRELTDEEIEGVDGGRIRRPQRKKKQDWLLSIPDDNVGGILDSGLLTGKATVKAFNESSCE